MEFGYQFDKLRRIANGLHGLNLDTTGGYNSLHITSPIHCTGYKHEYDIENPSLVA